MKLEEAQRTLRDCFRDELADHSFGDLEVSWFRDGVEIAAGYRGSSGCDVMVSGHKFSGEDARILMGCGRLGRHNRNDDGAR